MPLIEDPRITQKDMEVWRRLERYDAQLSRSPKLTRKIEDAERAIVDFFRHDPGGYAGVSWGKDSVVVADLVMRYRPETPLVWVKVWPHANPDCERVRDEFLRAWPAANYSEVVVDARADGQCWHTSKTLCEGFEQAERKHGRRHVSGVRAGESGARKMAMMRFGTQTIKTCRPIGWWSGADVFAYLHRNGLPVHPAYAMSMGGSINREHLRVASLGGESGTGHNRRQWEQVYYRHRIEEITRMWEGKTGIYAGDRFVL